MIKIVVNRSIINRIRKDKKLQELVSLFTRHWMETPIDTSRIAVLPLDAAQGWIAKNCKPATLTTAEVIAIEQVLDSVIAGYNAEQAKYLARMQKQYPQEKFHREAFVIDLERYQRQYVPFFNQKGEKEVWINCFCNNSEPDWRKYIVFVLDGGNCYFNLKVNLDQGSYYEFMVNGEA